MPQASYEAHRRRVRAVYKYPASLAFGSGAVYKYPASLAFGSADSSVAECGKF